FRTVGVANVAAEPGLFGPPVHVLIGLPYVLASTTEAESFEPHCFESDIPGENHQVSTLNLSAVLLLNRPKESTGLVQADVVRPTIKRREALLPSAAATAAVTCAIGAGAVPRHANEQRTIVTEVRRPPIL